MKSDRYFATIARSVGVPEMWLEDCVQELRIAEWQGRTYRHTAIDFVREYGPHARGGLSRECAYLEDNDLASADWTDISDQLLDLEVSFGKLREDEKAALLRFYVGAAQEGRDWRLRYWGRLKLRQAA